MGIRASAMVSLLLISLALVPGCQVLGPSEQQQALEQAGLVQPKRGSPEAAAKAAFEIWAQRGGRPYQNVTYQILTNDGTFATVRVLADLRSAAEAPWLENEAQIECRNVGGEWQCDEPWYFALTAAEETREANRQLATATARVHAQQATATAVVEAQQAAATAEAEASLQPLYEQALSAHGAANWVEAAYYFRQLLGIREDYRDASELYAESAGHIGRIVFSSGGDIYIMNADGSHLSQLTSHEMAHDNPVLSPDGSKIAFLSDCDLYLINSDGTGRTLLATQLYCSEGQEPALSWSSDGLRVFTPGGSVDIGTGHRAELPYCGYGVIRSQHGDCPRYDPGYVIGFPVLSPDGTRVAGEYVPGEYGGVLAVLNVDGSGTPLVLHEYLFGRCWSWSPDGQYLAMTDDDNFIRVYNVDTGESIKPIADEDLQTLYEDSFARGRARICLSWGP